MPANVREILEEALLRDKTILLEFKDLAAVQSFGGTIRGYFSKWNADMRSVSGENAIEDLQVNWLFAETNSSTLPKTWPAMAKVSLVPRVKKDPGFKILGIEGPDGEPDTQSNILLSPE